MMVKVSARDIPFVPVTIQLDAGEVGILVTWMEKINQNAANPAPPKEVSDLYIALIESKWGGRKL